MAKSKKKPTKTGVPPLLGRETHHRGLGITFLNEVETPLPGRETRHPGLGLPGQAHPVQGQIKALVMPVDLPTLCVDAEGCAHDVVCHIAELRALVVRHGYGSAYSVGRLEELMRRLNMGVERLKLELRAAAKKNKKPKD
jgi:hypothetical protein